MLRLVLHVGIPVFYHYASCLTPFALELDLKTYRFIGKENVEQTLQKYQADVTKLNKDLTDAQAGKTAVEADLKHKKSELKQRASEYEQLQSAKSELETSSAGKLKVFPNAACGM